MALDFGEFGGRCGRGEETHVVEFFEEELFVFVSKCGVWREGGEAVGELFETLRI